MKTGHMPATANKGSDMSLTRTLNRDEIMYLAAHSPAAPHEIQRILVLPPARESQAALIHTPVASMAPIVDHIDDRPASDGRFLARARIPYYDPKSKSVRHIVLNIRGRGSKRIVCVDAPVYVTVSRLPTTAISPAETAQESGRESK